MIIGEDLKERPVYGELDLTEAEVEAGSCSECSAPCGLPCTFQGVRARPHAARLQKARERASRGAHPVACQFCGREAGEAEISGSHGICDPCLDARYPRPKK